MTEPLGTRRPLGAPLAGIIIIIIIDVREEKHSEFGNSRIPEKFEALQNCSSSDANNVVTTFSFGTEMFPGVKAVREDYGSNIIKFHLHIRCISDLFPIRRANIPLWGRSRWRLKLSSNGRKSQGQAAYRIPEAALRAGRVARGGSSVLLYKCDSRAFPSWRTTSPSASTCDAATAYPGKVATIKKVNGSR